jgi:indolepyruvate ferredoxin oxidoreductase beta subunit
VLLIKARETAEQLGNLRVANTVLLGALAAQLDVPESDWMAVVEARVPERHIDVNRDAFRAGYDGKWKT